jgi:hypothetical protein
VSKVRHSDPPRLDTFFSGCANKTGNSTQALPPAVAVPPDDFDLATIAARLGKSARWLVGQLTEDRRRLTPRLQFHHYIGRSPRWDEHEYQALRAALIAGADKRRSSLASPVGALGRLTAKEARDAAAASAVVQAWPLRPTPARLGRGRRRDG